MSGRWRWIGIGLTVATTFILIWVLLQSPAPEPGRPAVLLRRTATRAPAVRPSPGPQSGQIPAVEVERTTMSTVDAQGRRQWEIHADAVVVDGAANTATLTGVRGTYFQRGEAAISFSAPRGTFNVATRAVALAGGVKARAVSGRTVQADVVEWFPKTQQITATGAVVLRQKGLIVRADRLTADVALRRASLQGNIRVTVEE